MAPVSFGIAPDSEFRKQLRACTLDALHGKKFILTSRLKEWFLSTGAHSSSTQVEKLLWHVYHARLKRSPGLPISAESISLDSLLIFSILLEIEHGELINQFREHSKVDSKLPFNKTELLFWLREHQIPSDNPKRQESLAERFWTTQWKYSLEPFHLGDGKTHPQQCILPICQRQTINKKGATAHLWEIEVPEEFVGDTLRDQNKNSRYKSQKNYGWCYRFALKSFNEHNFDLFQNEKKAFDSLRSQNAMISCFGHFEWKEPVETSHTARSRNDTQDQAFGKTYNILFEYGESDLEEFFVQNHPPLLEQEILSFWETLYGIIDAVKAIHNLKTYEEGDPFKGWHADIKPDNILLVNGKFKLADPGFAKFVNASDKDKMEEHVKEKIYGGTWTYAPPERCRDDQGAVDQTIDIWSLGCVFSIAATWVVGGYSAVRDFNKVRKNAIQGIKTQKSGDLPSLKSADLFHNGKDVLSDVTAWHALMRNSSRRVDPITSNILDLVDEKMLRAEPEKRLSADRLSVEFGHIIQSCKERSPEPIPESIMKALLEINDEAPVGAQNSSAVPQSPLSPVTTSDRKTRKSIILNIPLKRTARRSEYLMSALSNSIKAQGAIEEETPPAGETSTKRTQRPQHTPQQASAKDLEVLAENTSNIDLTAESKHAKLQTQDSFERPHEPQDVHEALQALQKRRKRSLLNPSGKQKDDVLSRYIRNRDIIFLVDNAETMREHWIYAKIVLKALVMKLEGLDKNGMDLHFTFGEAFLKNWKKVADFERKMDTPDAQPKQGNHTDIVRSIAEIFSSHLRSMQHTKKDLTFIILTDGIWQGMRNKDDIQDKVIELAREVERINGRLRKRSLTFQFVQFGEDEGATSRLRYLDDALAHEKDIADVIDTEHANGDAYKMILGSFIEEYDFSDVPAATALPGPSYSESPSKLAQSP